MDYVLLTPDANQIWLFDSIDSGFSYRFIMKPLDIQHVQKVHPVMDSKGYLHLVLLNSCNQAFHLIWDNMGWKKERLPFQEWEQILTFSDSSDILHILIKNSAGTHIFTSPGSDGVPPRKLSPLADNNSCLLFFTLDNARKSLFLYSLRDKTTSTLKMTEYWLETGEVISENILAAKPAFGFGKAWNLGDFVILIGSGKSGSRYQRFADDFYVSRIPVNGKQEKFESYRFKNPAGGSGHTFHLLADFPQLLLLISAAGVIVSLFSSDGGKTWSAPSPVFIVYAGGLSGYLNGQSLSRPFCLHQKNKGLQTAAPFDHEFVGTFRDFSLRRRSAAGCR